MMRDIVLVTGSSGLIGSEVALHFDRRGADVHGLDNNMRMSFFGPDGDTSENLARLRATCRRFTHHAIDIRDRESVLALVKEIQPTLVVHAAAQPSHDLAAQRPFDDFDVNAVGTLNLLEAVRRFAGDAVFVHMSTNKVYGDRPNQMELVERETRWDYAREEDYHGVSESMPIDRCLHSLFGASKVAADVMVQEYGRYFGLRTCVFRGGCLTGAHHAGAQQHGFLNYLFRCVLDGRQYTVIGYKGKQVRDQIHACDVSRAIEAVYHRPCIGGVYNLGGGRENSVSILEAIDRIEQLTGNRCQWDYQEQPRKGDHICYISDLRAFRRDYPEWNIAWSLDDILEDMWKQLRLCIG